MVAIRENWFSRPLSGSGDTGKNGDTLYLQRLQAVRQFGLDQKKIENILSCTPLQSDIIDCAFDDRRCAIGHVIYEIPSTVDIERLAAAWKEVVRQTPALRTRIFTSESGDHFRVILSEGFAWMRLVGLDRDEAVQEEEAAAAVPGARCNRYAILGNSSTGQRLLIWTFSHALVDSASQERILQDVLIAYDGGEVQRSPGTVTEVLANPLARDPKDVTQFWKQHFDDLNASVFPSLPSHLIVPRPDAQVEYRISYPEASQPNWDNTTVCRAALSVLLARYTHASEALFGVVVDRPNHPVDGPTRSVVPTRVLCAPHQSCSDLIRAISTHDVAMREFAHSGLQAIRSTGEDGFAACGFQTVLEVTTGGTMQTPSSILLQAVAGSDNFVPSIGRAFFINCQIVDGSAVLLARYDSSVIDVHQATRFLQQLGSLIKQLQGDAPDLPVQDLDAFTQEDRAQVHRWNSAEIKTTEVCIHEVFSKRTVETPDKIAVSAWDGQWTYTELDSISSRLALYIQSLDLDVECGPTIPLCFGKSKWILASMLAVLKAGRSFTLIDPSYPAARIARICQQTSATVCLVAKVHCEVMRDVISHSILLDDDFSESLLQDNDQFTRIAKPHDLAYIIFTSGSTGEPKGSMIEHRGFTSCSSEFGPQLGISNNTRSIQFASYAYGPCLLETLTTLMHGGCVCIPSDYDRINNVADFINRERVNWAVLTPSFIGTILPESVPGLQTLILGGEPMSVEMRDTWACRLRLLNGYGQSETTTICSVTEVGPYAANLNSIGRAVGARFWVTDANNPDKLAPIGCIGELIVESPGVARGYLVAPPRDKASFLATTPAWYPEVQALDFIRFFKTGDLVRYRSDGTILYLGRRDSQVKIRGQRVELGDVETHLRHQLPSHLKPLVEAVKPSGATSSTILIAILIGPVQDGDGAPNTILAKDAWILENSAANRMNIELKQALPHHSIPSFYIRMKQLPTTAAGKTDRRKLRLMSVELLDKALGR